MRPDGWGRGDEVSITLPYRSGRAQVTEVRSSMVSNSVRRLVVTARVAWADGRRSVLVPSINGVSVEDQVELGLRAGLFGESLPQQLGSLSGTVDASDPLAPLDGLGLPQDAYEPIARLLLVERLLGDGGASRVDEVSIGSEHQGRRPIEIAWTEAAWATNVTPGRRMIAGQRRSASS